jgi:5-methylcytosine-specific restriction endonuclease McrA
MRAIMATRRKDPAKLSADRAAEAIARQTPRYRAKAREYDREYKKNNRDRANHYRAMREARKTARTPAWLSNEDVSDIQDTYTLSRQLTKETGVDHHVDHVIPLNGFLVSGLHVPWNLQVITAQDNMEKGNRFSV